MRSDGVRVSDFRCFPAIVSSCSSTAADPVLISTMNSIEARLDALESLVDDQQTQIESHKETIAAQQETIDAQRERLDAVEGGGGVSLPISRRGALTAGGALGLLGLGAGTASAAGTGQIGTGDRPVDTVYTQKLNGGLTEGEEINNLLGWGLQIYPTEQLGVDFDVANHLDTWGNVGWENATHLDETGKIRSDPVLELTTENDTKAGHILGGHSANSIEADFAAVISGGGGDDTESNRIWEEGNYGTIGGGASNKLGGIGATIAGGGGFDMADGAFVGNTANGDWTAIGGGRENTAEGTAATVPGGDNNTASGDYSFAVGRGAKVKEEHNGAFVVGDSSDTEFESQKQDEAWFQMNVVAEDVIANGDVIAEENVAANAFELVELRGDTATDELSESEGMIYISEGEDGGDEDQFGDKGDLVYGYNDSEGNIERVVIAENPHNV